MPSPATAAVRLLTGEREPVRLATTANIDVDTGGLLTIDGIVTEVGDRVLVKDQTDGSENGIRTASAGQWYRASDARSARTIQKGTTVAIQEGATYAGKYAVFNTLDPVIGDDSLSITILPNPILETQLIDEDDMVSNSDTKVPSQQSVKAYVDASPATAPLQAALRDRLDTSVYVADITALTAVDFSKDKVAEVWNAGGRNGTFDWVSGNQSANVTLDPQQGIYVAPASAPTGASGAWVRRAGFLMGAVQAAWFGMAPTATSAANVTALQAACTFGAPTVVVPSGTCTLNATITPITRQTIRGEYSSGLAGISVLTVPAAFNSTLFNLDSGQTLRNINLLGTATSSETSQVLVLIASNNHATLENCIVDNGYDNVKVTGVSFYVNFRDTIFYRGIRSQLYVDGANAAGADLNIRGCRFLACAGSFNMYFNLLGSLVVADTMVSVNSVTECCMKFDQKATLYGGMQLSNVVIEPGSSSARGVRYIGAVGAEWHTIEWTNSFIGGGGGDAFQMEHVNVFEFNGGVIQSGTSSKAFTIPAGVTASFTNFKIKARFEAVTTTGAQIVAGAGATVSGSLLDPIWTGSGALVDFSAATVSRLDCTPGRYGSAATPVVLPAGTTPGLRLTENNGSGLFTPVISGTTVAGAGTYVIQSGTWTKIGDRVFGDIDVQISAHTGTGNMIITGLPFALKTGGVPANVIITPITLTFAARPGGTISAASTQITLVDNASGAGTTPLAMDTACRMIISFSYQTNF